jgi:uncharacterized protein (DUF2267 family)
MDVRGLWAGMPRAARIYLGAVGGLFVAGCAVLATVVVASAASPSPSPSASPKPGSANCDRFTQHVASNLGKTPAQVRKAINDAIGQTLNDAVKSGEMTQQQADNIKAKLGSSSSSACVGVPRFGPGGPGGFGPGGFGRSIFKGTMADIATALGISQSELQQDLQSGKTVKDVAASKGMDENAFRQKYAAAVKADLDQQVKSGNITQTQEDMILQRIQNAELPFWNGVMHRGLNPIAPGASPSPNGAHA